MILKYKTIICILCGKEFNSQGTHLRQHNITNKCYYDKYLKTDDEGKCLVCGEPTRYYSMKYGYKSYCSDKCAANSDILINNKKQTCQKKYGCDYVLQNKNIREKSTATRKENNNGCYFSEESITKMKNTNKEKYGVDYYLQTKECKQKLTEQCQKEFGVDYYTQTNKCIENHKKLYKNEETKNNILNKTKKTCKNKYGCEYSFQSENNKIKSKNTKLLKYGDENYVNTEKAQQTCLTKYGVKHPAQSPVIDCTSHRITYNDLNFDSLWEFKYYKYLVDNNIEFTYKPKITLEFEYDGEIRKYKPDFIVEGKLTEIKGDHFFKNGKIFRKDCFIKLIDNTLNKLIFSDNTAIFFNQVINIKKI